MSLVLLSACEGAGASDEFDVDELPRLASAQGMRIGSVDDPDYGFSRPYALDIDRDGNLYVGEALDTQIRVYGADGWLLRRIGGPGGGPGEFQNAPRFGVVGDTVWTYDIVARRITLFGRDGTLLATAPAQEVSIPVPVGFGYVSPWAMGSDGLFSSHLGRLAYNPRDAAPTGVEAGDSMPVPRIRFRATGEVVDTVGWEPSPPPRMVPPPGTESRFEMIEVGMRRYMVPDAPSVLPHWLPLNDGRIEVDIPLAEAADRGTFTVTRIGLAGDTVYSRRLNYRPVAYTPADLDEVAALAARGVTAQMAPAGGPDAGAPDPAAQAALRAAMSYPEFRPPISWSWVDADERVWLRRDESADDVDHWILLDADGRPWGELELASRTRVLWSRGDVFWSIELDEFDVPWLVEHRIGG